jgi:hypothetical protein
MLLDVFPPFSPGDSSGARYVLKDTSSDNKSELTSPLSRTEVYQVFLSVNELFHQIRLIKTLSTSRMREKEQEEQED